MKKNRLLEKFFCRAVRLACVIAFGLCFNTLYAAPVVNGLFYGDGDYSEYTLYAISENGSRLYVSYADSRLYVALVVSRAVNDNVFSSKSDKAYVQNAGWSSHRDAKRLMDSEFASFSLEVGDQSWNWQQGYAGQPDGGSDPSSATWISDATVSGGTGTPPPGYDSSSSIVWNLNTYASDPAPAWNMTVLGSSQKYWKSPFDYSSPDHVTGLDGYPSAGEIGFSSVYQWEWPMVYEWSVDMSSFGSDPVYVLTGLSHHSPSKTGNENDQFTDMVDSETNVGPLTDLGDLPAPYQTTLADDGARHWIVPGAVSLGTSVDPDPNGASEVTANGDDAAGLDDEDGVALVDYVRNSHLAIEVTISDRGYLSAFFDFATAGVLQPATLLSSSGPSPVAPGLVSDLYLAKSGTYTMNFAVPSTIAPVIAARFRITNESGQGGASPTGEATTGEVEDYLWQGVSALSTEIAIKAYAEKGKEFIDISTVNENGNNDIEIYALINGEWVMVAMLPSEDIIGFGSNSYTVEADGLIPNKSYKFKIIDETGHIFEMDSPVKVEKVRIRAVKTSLGPKTFTMTFSTEPYVWYVLNVSHSLAADAKWKTEYVQVVHPAFPDGVSDFCMEFQGAPDGTTTLQVPRNNKKAFFKLVEVE